MSFGQYFEGYFLLHGHHLAPARLPLVEKELARVGVDNYSIKLPASVTEEELRRSKFDRAPPLSVLKSVIECVEIAKEQGWKSFFFLEDDVVFRRDFAKMWSSVEESLRGREWGMLTLFRWPTEEGQLIVREHFFRPASVTAIRHNICGHAYAFHSRFYDTVLDAFRLCLEKGWPADFIYGILTDAQYGMVLATTKNLAGQRGGLASQVQLSYKRGFTHYSLFRSSLGWLDFFLVNRALPLVRNLRKLNR